MSGGTYDYEQYKIRMIHETIQSELDRMGTKKPKDELYSDDDYYKDYPEQLVYYTYSDEVIKEFKNAIEVLKRAEVYAQRVDWLLAGDDGEETFLERLKEDIASIDTSF